jgi:hypothetical protein
VGSLTSHNPIGLHDLLRGQLYFFTFTYHLNPLLLTEFTSFHFYFTSWGLTLPLIEPLPEGRAGTVWTPKQTMLFPPVKCLTHLSNFPFHLLFCHNLYSVLAETHNSNICRSLKGKCSVPFVGNERFTNLCVYRLIAILCKIQLLGGHNVLHSCELCFLSRGKNIDWAYFKTGCLWPRGEEVTESWRKLTSQDIHNLYSSPIISKLIKWRRMRCKRHLACMGKTDMPTKFWYESSE